LSNTKISFIQTFQKDLSAYSYRCRWCCEWYYCGIGFKQSNITSWKCKKKKYKIRYILPSKNEYGEKL